MFSFLQLDDRAVDAVLDKLFKNYKMWCRFLGRKHSLRLDVEALSLYLFILYYLLFASYAWFAICIAEINKILFDVGYLKVSRKYNRGRYFTWVYIFSYGVKQRMFALCLNASAIFSIT